ncbi:MAG: energy-coupling factor transporter ATPase [Selenomonadaceae bacterium]|nr:energy-coupling factor transporter ATPase [Selenomonadaceae bacterium]
MVTLLIEIKDLSYKYEERLALDEINLTIGDGEFIAIIGANGSGKSTLAKNLNGLLTPTEGRVLVDGIDTTVDVWTVRTKVGMVFQNPDNQIVGAIVEDDVAFGPENLGVDPIEIRRRVDEALSTVGMLEYKTFSPYKLSGGQKQRVAIAGVLAMQTKCIVFDEATAMLDPRGRSEVLSTIEQLHAKGMTIILITHFMEEAARASRVAVMSGGKIVRQGSPLKIFSDVKFLERIGLEVPMTVQLAARLRLKNVLTVDDLVGRLRR